METCRKDTKHVIHNRRHSYHIMASWYGFIGYDGWTDSCSTCHRYCFSTLKSDSRKKNSLDFHELRSMSDGLHYCFQEYTNTRFGYVKSQESRNAKNK